MEEKILDLLKARPIMIPRYLFKNYKRLNITEEELIILIYIIDLGNKVEYNPIYLSKELDMDKYKVMELINNLVEKKIVTMIVEKNSDNKSGEYISLDLFYIKIFNLLIDSNREEEKTTDNSDIFSIFESEFGRTISPMEIEIIKGWTTDGLTHDLIIEALKEATYNGVSNLRYIDKILYEWKKKGFKTKDDIVKDKDNYRNTKKDKKDVFDYNWLDEE